MARRDAPFRLSLSLLAWSAIQVGSTVLLQALSKLTIHALKGIPGLPRRPASCVMAPALKELSEKQAKGARRQSRRERRQAVLLGGKAACPLSIPVYFLRLPAYLSLVHLPHRWSSRRSPRHVGFGTSIQKPGPAVQRRLPPLLMLPPFRTSLAPRPSWTSLTPRPFRTSLAPRPFRTSLAPRPSRSLHPRSLPSHRLSHRQTLLLRLGLKILVPMLAPNTTISWRISFSCKIAPRRGF